MYVLRVKILRSLYENGFSDFRSYNIHFMLNKDVLIMIVIYLLSQKIL